MYLNIEYNRKLNSDHNLFISNYFSNKIYKLNNDTYFLQLPILENQNNFFNIRYYSNNSITLSIKDCRWNIILNNFLINNYIDIPININSNFFSIDSIDSTEFDENNYFCFKNTKINKPQKILITINDFPITIDHWINCGLCQIGYSDDGNCASILHSHNKSNLSVKIKNIPYLKDESIILYSSINHHLLFNELNQTDCSKIFTNFTDGHILSLPPIMSKFCPIDNIQNNNIKISTLYD